jgi:hypothetical protein
MKMFLTVVALCLPALGQAVYSGPGSYLGPAISNGGNCASPNYCAYNGVDLIPAGTPPNVSNSDGTNNGATVYDTTFLGHASFDGSTFSNPAYLSPVTRLTDVNSSTALCNAYTAGEGGSGAVTAVNTNTSLVAVTCNGSEFVGLFNTSGPNKGHFTPIHSGVLITRDLCVSGCVSGSSSQTEDFGSTVFSHTDPNTLFSFGINNSEITTATTVCPYSINPATGAYSLLTCLVDFKYGLPQYNAPQWAASTNYNWGDYVIHPLSSAEMATGGVWTTGHIYALGDIVVAQSGSIACMYVLVAASGTATTGPAPSFINGNGNTVCKTDTLADATGNKWRGTSSTAQFLYQNTGAAGTSGSSFVLTGKPDLLSTLNDGTNIVWTNVGPAYVPVQHNGFWMTASGVSSDATYNVGGIFYPSKYSTAISTNTYGSATAGYSKYTGSQGTGADVIVYDATANAFQHLNTLTGIWTTFTCGDGTNGLTCSGIRASTVGTVPLTQISNPLGGGPCPYLIHNSSMNGSGTAPYSLVTEQGGYLGTGCSGILPYQVWNESPSAFNAVTSLQVSYAGFNHSAIDQTELVAFNGSGSSNPCCNYTGGWFTSIYQLSSVSSQPAVSVYLAPAINLPGSGSYPSGCYSSPSGSQQPSCNLAAVLDSHLSCVGGCDHGSFHGCGTSYNYANLGPAFNAWQNMETCWPTGTAYSASSLPGSSAGPVSQFTHTNATGTCGVFSCQFQISEWSQDGNWLFWSSDWGCQLGSTTGSAPVVWSSGSYYQAFIQPSVPAGLTSLCGYPWLPGTSYAGGNTITPIEGTTGIGAIDDVFQALTSGTSGPNSSIGSNQPACLQYMNVAGVWTANTAGSCFAGTNPPSMTALTVTGASESGTTGTIVVSTGVALNVGAQVTLTGFTPAGWNGTFPVAGTVGANCPGTNCAAVTSFQPAGLPSGLSAATALGTAASEGDRVCDSPSDNGSGSVNSLNPSGCSAGVMWQDLGPQTQRGDVFAVNLGNQH